MGDLGRQFVVVSTITSERERGGDEGNELRGKREGDKGKGKRMLQGEEGLTEGREH